MDNLPLDKKVVDLASTLERLASQSLNDDARRLVNEAMGQTAQIAHYAAMEAEVQRLNQALVDATQARAKFVSVVTHELRIPMTAIKGYTDLLRQGMVGPVNETQISFLDVIRNNVDRLAALVSDLADLSRLETGRLKIDLQVLALPEYVEAVLRNLYPQLEAKGQTLELELATDLPAVCADANRVQQVLSNLLNNASKYTPTGGRIRLAATSEAKQVRIAISDNGIGIGIEDQEKLFDEFFRSEETEVRKQPGWGLGLSVARGLVEAMGGRIGCESTFGQGSTFWFILPVSSKS